MARAFKPNTPGVSINSQLKRVRFIVRVNQTFESGTMEVKEGVVSPVQVTQQVAVPATITTPQEKTENPLPAAEADDKNSSTPP